MQETTQPKEDNKKETTLNNEQPKEDNKQPKSNFKEPAITFFVHIVKKFLKMTVRLPKVPDKFVKLDCYDKTFRIDTTGFTRKFFVE